MMSVRRKRICRTHNQHGVYVIEPCDIVEMVWSSDGSALLAIDQCAECGGTGQGPSVPAPCPTPEAYGTNASCLVAHFEPKPCPKCDGEGYTYQARTVEGKNRKAERDGYAEGWNDALDAQRAGGDPYAVVPL